MRVAIIEGGIVANICEADQSWVVENGGIVLADDSPVGIGWIHLGGSAFEEQPVAIIIPTSLTPRQIRLVLNASGLREQVEAAVAMASQDIKDMWGFSLEYKRDDPVLAAMVVQIGITEAQLDVLFTQGAAL